MTRRNRTKSLPSESTASCGDINSLYIEEEETQPVISQSEPLMSGDFVPPFGTETEVKIDTAKHGDQQTASVLDTATKVEIGRVKHGDRERRPTSTLDYNFR